MKRKQIRIAAVGAVLLILAGIVAGKLAGNQHGFFGISRRKKVVCVGDSITYGSGVRKKRGKKSYPAYLQKKLGRGYRVINYGLYGRTLLDYGKYPYIKEEEYQKGLEEKADIYIIMLGTNDSKISMWNAQDYQEQLGQMIEGYRRVNREAEIYILQPPRCFPDEETGKIKYSIRNDIIEGEIHESIAVTGKKYGVTVIDIYHLTEKHSEWFVDGVHPNEKGNEAIADCVYKNMVSSFSVYDE